MTEKEALKARVLSLETENEMLKNQKARLEHQLDKLKTQLSDLLTGRYRANYIRPYPAYTPDR